ncbi:primosomal protein N' [Salinicoccus halodurans]|uniref:Replication restart protein PriA n=1 Tax=Salinicoccus halodurans TaxID=407035 RepID=A0A0F7D473_9STAP|nr:primosomal protein N' [Salinicoccus halodurans]AKG73735.1 primosomal protein N' [Salinicoccus halodurans]SFK55054.1 replication restart DNA helicase PriA [Salinicoccus halodurans]
MFASVIVDVPSKSVNQVFDYRIPSGMQDIIKVGHRVVVPFGRRTIQGYVMNIKDTADFDPSKIKPISRTLDIEPVLTEEMIVIAKYLAEYYVDQYISVIETILPAALKANYKKIIRAAGDDGEAAQALRNLGISGDIETSRLTADQLSVLRPHFKSGELVEETVISQHTRKKTALGVYSLKVPEPNLGRAKKQIELLERIDMSSEPILLGTLQEEGYSNGMVNTLYKKGLIDKVDVEIERDPYSGRIFEYDKPKVLNGEQRRAYEEITQSMDEKSAETFLLHGITGSGKTEVYLQVIQKALNEGRTAIMLVPEIALTPQMVNRFKMRFGDDVAVLHSGLSPGEKYDEWRKIKEGRARVSVGARSSVFAPFENVGVIIIDEEHETTYKQSDRPMYHAAEVAKFRSRRHGCPLILGTATPSLETYARSEKGVYRRLELTERAGTKILPEIRIVDMSEQHRAGNTSVISTPLHEAITDRLEKGEQTVLLLNRRGYSNFQICQSCGHVPMCPNCDISLTYHKSNSSLLCHYCGYESRVTRQCDNCSSEDVTFRGTGTEKVEEILRDMFETDVVRMDNDTTRRKGMHEKLLNHFEKDEIPILLGTQMIAKGLDYPKVTLVGVLNADTMLNLPDFRANEKTFQLLTQVSGRAGRHELSGEVIFQTYNPTHYAIELATHNDYRNFYEKEMAFRRMARYSPFYFHVLFTVSSEDVRKCLGATSHIHETLAGAMSEQSIIVGPSPSPIERINRQHRFQILLKYKREPALLELLNELDAEYHEKYKKEGISLKIDVNPLVIM